MSNFGRLLLLGLFGSCGIGVAVCLTLNTNSVSPTSVPADSIHDLSSGSGAPQAALSVATGAADADNQGPPANLSDESNPGDAIKFRASSSPSLTDVATMAASPAVASPAVTRQVSGASDEPKIPISTMIDLIDKVFNRTDQTNQIAQDVTQRVQQPDAPPAEPLPTPPQALLNKNIVKEGDDRLTLNLNQTDIREVLELLSQGSGQNIIATRSVDGTVTATLQNVDFDTALRGILRSTGYIAQREGEIIFVGLPEEFEGEAAPAVRVVTRVYEPNYITAAELQALITPLLTPDIGTISVSSPADNGIAVDSSTAGGDSFANSEILLVRDYEPVLYEIDQIITEVDRQPMQVAIEAMILSVRLNDTNKLGVNFELLRDRTDLRLVSGTPPNNLANLNISEGGLKLGILNTSVSALIEALETVGDTNVIATPRLLALNKQKAEILIGSQLGYVSSTVTETALTQTVEFLDVGTQLRLRPFISRDGNIRMEIHPELSTGEVRVEGGFTLPDKEVTEVTTNIMARDGSTILIGGLIREDLSTSSTQIPLFGSLPKVGWLFRQKTEDLERREIIVLITPRIIYDEELAREGDLAAMEFHHRQAVKFNKFSPLGTRKISHDMLLRAQAAWARGDGARAMHYVNLAIHYNPESRAAIDLRADIFNGTPVGDHTGQLPYIPMPNGPGPLDGPGIAPWVLDGIDPAAGPSGPPVEPFDRGQPGQPGRQFDIRPRGAP